MAEALVNIGMWERVLRIGLGAAILGFIVASQSPWRWLGLIGIVPLATGLLGWCPFYSWITRD
jgi:hypothetical protein